MHVVFLKLAIAWCSDSQNFLMAEAEVPKIIKILCIIKETWLKESWQEIRGIVSFILIPFSQIDVSYLSVIEHKVFSKQSMLLTALYSVANKYHHALTGLLQGQSSSLVKLMDPSLARHQKVTSSQAFLMILPIYGQVFQGTLFHQ